MGLIRPVVLPYDVNSAVGSTLNIWCEYLVEGSIIRNQNIVCACREGLVENPRIELHVIGVVCTDPRK